MPPKLTIQMRLAAPLEVLNI